ncbi:FG-GAP-like repeat-containing protein [Runella sp.]|uniref:FG-GAP-like repeat-containing protein n=1 Tax=Runella sp. TaxID=1960881 RepID=UPI0026064649|nr:FG-GAP-like repeat-containing protein [Runella sp.]
MNNTLLAFLLMAVAFQFVNAQAPIITNFSPTSGPVGTSVTITGTGFDATNNIVFFGATKASVTAAGPTSLTVTVPTATTYQYISVTNLTNNLTAYSAKPFVVTLAGTIAFDAKQDQTTGTTPKSVSIGDIDGDGKPDLAVANSGSNTVSILRNTSTSGTVSFATKVDFTTGSSPVSVSIGDIDGDGKPDLAVVNGVDNSVSVLCNTSTSGTVSFASKADFTTGTGPTSVVIGDIDGDGKPDLAVTNGGSNNVSILRNTSSSGAISFATKVDFFAASNPTSVAIGDIDGNGKADLAVTQGDGGDVAVLRNTSTSGTISFATRIVLGGGPGNYSVAIGDIDGDGKPDLAIANLLFAGGGVSLFRNTSTSGTISFAGRVDFVSGKFPKSITMGDIDGDGKPDLAVANSTTNTVSVFRNTSSSGTVSLAGKVDFTTGTAPWSAVIGDIDGDEKPDLTVANSSGNDVSLFRQSVPQGSLTANGPFCASGTGQLTWTSTAGPGPYTVVYNDGTANRTASNVTSGTPFNVFTNPVNSTTTYTLVSVAYPDNSVQTTGFAVGTATITVNPLPIVSTSAASVFVDSTITLTPTSGGTWVSSDPAKASITNAGLVTGKSSGVVNFTFTATATGCSATTSNVTVINSLSPVQATEFSPNYILVPQLTFAQISAISSPKRGMIVYDLTNNCLRVFTGEWKCISLN